MRKIALLLLLMIAAAACQPGDESDDLPTLAQLPTLTDTAVPSSTPTATLTATATLTYTPLPSDTPVPTETDPPSATFTPSESPIPSNTPDATSAAIGTATAQVLEAPSFATLTPLPPGPIGAVRPTSTGTPEIVADVLITEMQFQEELDRILTDETRVSSAQVRFVSGEGLEVRLTALSDDIFITGTFQVPFRISDGGINNILQIGGQTDIVMDTGEEPSEEFVEVALTVVTPAVQEAFGDILDQRLGAGQHDLERLIITEQEMAITLYVPDPGP